MLLLGTFLSFINIVYLLFFSVIAVIPFIRNDTVLYDINEDDRIIIDREKDATHLPINSIEVVETVEYSSPIHDLRTYGIMLVVFPVMLLVFSYFMSRFVGTISLKMLVLMIGLIVTGIVCLILDVPTISHVFITDRSSFKVEAVEAIVYKGLGITFLTIGAFLTLLGLLGTFDILLFDFHFPDVGLYLLSRVASRYYNIYNDLGLNAYIDIIIIVLFLIAAKRWVRRPTTSVRIGHSLSIMNIPPFGGSIEDIVRKATGNPIITTAVTATEKVENFLTKKTKFLSLSMGALGALIWWIVYTHGNFYALAIYVFVIVIPFVLFPTGARWTASIYQKGLHIFKTFSEAAKESGRRDARTRGITHGRVYVFRNMSSLTLEKNLNWLNLGIALLTFSIGIFLFYYLKNILAIIPLLIVFSVSIPYMYASLPQWAVGFKGRSGRIQYILPIKRVIRIQDDSFVRSLNKAYVNAINRH